MPILFRHAFPLVLALAVLLPASLAAQGRGQPRAERPDPGRVIILDGDRGHDRRGGDRDDRWDDDRRRDDDRWDDDDRRDDRRWNRHEDRRRERGGFALRDGRRVLFFDRDDFWRYPVRSGRGPAFCRSGEGHPVFGLRWCLEKGFGLGRPGTWFLRGDDVFFLGGDRVIVLRDRGRDADLAFWSRVAGQVLARID